MNLTDAVPLVREDALKLCQLEMGDIVVLDNGDVMKITEYECYTKQFQGRVYMQTSETYKWVSVQSLMVRLNEQGEPYRELTVRSGAFPLIERTPIADGVVN